jgi:hypothetical protein
MVKVRDLQLDGEERVFALWEFYPNPKATPEEAWKKFYVTINGLTWLVKIFGVVSLARWTSRPQNFYDDWKTLPGATEILPDKNRFDWEEAKQAIAGELTEIFQPLP